MQTEMNVLDVQESSENYIEIDKKKKEEEEEEEYG